MKRVLRECLAKVLRRFRFPGRKRVIDLAEKILGPNSGEFVVPVRHSGHLIIDGIVDRPVFYTGTHDTHVMNFLLRVVQEGNTVVDIGAGIGVYTIPLALKVGPSGHVYAFEALRPNFDLLLRNIELNGLRNISATHAAIIDVSGILEVPIFDERPGGLGSLGNYSLASLSPRRNTISCWSLDDFAARSGITRIDLLKIDIEGSEVRAVSGMKRLFSDGRVRITCCEFNRYWLQKLGADPQELHNLFSSCGLQVYRLTRFGRLKKISAAYLASAPDSWDAVAKK